MLGPKMRECDHEHCTNHRLGGAATLGHHRGVKIKGAIMVSVRTEIVRLIHYFTEQAVLVHLETKGFYRYCKGYGDAISFVALVATDQDPEKLEQLKKLQDEWYTTTPNKE